MSLAHLQPCGRRLGGVHEAHGDAEARAIWVARAGKVLSGFSDVTALRALWLRGGFVLLHGQKTFQGAIRVKAGK